jgi:TDG/mug DNA glycosylase family protein
MDRPTVDFYETRAGDYEASRAATHLSEAESFGRRRPPGVAVDLGCGPGWYTAALGTPVVALDAALAMVRRAREVAPASLGVQADLTALPFRARSLGGGWARNTYVHLRASNLPLALADLHRAMVVGAVLELTLFRGEVEGRGVFPNDDFPGRWFSSWQEDRLRDVVEGAGFEVDELLERGPRERGFVVRATRAHTLPDVVAADMHLLVCGLNPSEHAADAGIGFVTANNRFWPATLATGLVTRDRDPWHALREHGVGFTDLVKRPTPNAKGLTRAEYRVGLDRLERLCAWLQPRAVCFVGLAGWRAATDPRAMAGWQERRVGGCPAYLMPSTSGANAATPLAELVEHLGAAAAGP